MRLMTALVLLAGCSSATVKFDDTDVAGDDSGVGPDDTSGVDADGDGFTADEDCDDADPAVHPGALERCDDADVDEDCDGLADDADPEGAEGTASIWSDGDGDGYGAPGDPLRQACDPGEGESRRDDDCDDSRAEVNPGATEVCGGGDEDCDGLVDDADDSLDVTRLPDWFEDRDGDGYGDPLTLLISCEDPEGMVGVGGDCDDTDPDINPGMPEVCDRLRTDEDCSGQSDDDDPGLDPASATAWYDDGDADGYGDASAQPFYACEQPWSMVEDDTDCDDTDFDVNPGAEEVCGGADEDCDGLVDEADPSLDPSSLTTFYADADSDGYGAPRTGRASCAAASGEVANGDDCDDSDALTHPGGQEVCGGGDEDCDGLVDDADGSVDASTTSTFYVDADRDGYGDAANTVAACTAPGGAVSDATDCDDTRADVSPGAPEICDSSDVDEDCDGLADDADPEGAQGTSLWRPDADSDGFGDSLDAGTAACDQPSTGMTLDDQDCDDGDASVNPSASEVTYDGVDNDCDGATDDGPALVASGWVVTGTTQENQVGSGGVILGPDLNNDGESELIIASPLDDATANSAGTVALFDASNFRSADRVAYTTGWVRVTGRRAGDGAGTAVALLGDPDGDSRGELAIGAPGYRASQNGAGAVWIVHVQGRSGRQVAHDIDDGRLEGASGNAGVGSALGVGDVDGDGLDDLVAGAPGESNARGRAWIATAADGYYRRSLSTSALSLWLEGPSAGDELGTALEVGGDLDGDGDADLVVCGPGDDAGGADAGACWLVAGGSSIASGTASTLAFATVRGASADDGVGQGEQTISVSDVDGDGVADLVVGVPGQDDLVSNGGAVMVFLGGSLSGALNETNADLLLRGRGRLGTGLAVAGDVDADGLGGDLLLGATTGGTGGVAWLLGGGLGSGTLSFGGDEGASWTAEASGDSLGAAFSAVGDPDGDGRQDFAVAAPLFDSGSTRNAGRVYVVSAYP